MFLRFFRLSILALEVGERHVQRLVSEADSDGVDRNTFFMQGVGVDLFLPIASMNCRHREPI